MSNILNKSHPFRASVTHDAPASAPVPEGSSSAPGPEGASLWDRANAGPPQEQRDFESLESAARRFRKRAKLLGGGLVLCILWYGYITIDELLTKPAPSIEASAGIPDWDEESFEYRDVEAARKSQGVFARLFCSSGRRSTFCE